MRALALTDSGVDVIDDAAEPDTGAQDVEVTIAGVGVCGTDLTLVRGDRSVPKKPWIIGHEAVGTVSRVGSSVEHLSPGDVVALEPNHPDLTCDQCQAGLTSRCAHRGSAGVSTPGYLVERAAIRAEFAWKLPSTMALEDAVCIEPMAVAVAAVRRSELPDDARVLVLGAGAQGLLAVLVLTAQGIVPTVTDLQSDRMGLARELGARELGDDDRFDHVIDTTGSAGALGAVLDHLDMGASVTIVGETSKDLHLSSQSIVQKALTIRGSFIYDHPIDFRTTIDLISTGKARPSRIVKNVAPLADAAQAIDDAPKKVGKTWIEVGR